MLTETVTKWGNFHYKAPLKSVGRRQSLHSIYEKTGIIFAEVGPCQGHRSVCCAVQGWQGSVPEERRYERLKGSVWPGAGSLSFFYPPDNNSDKRLSALPAAFSSSPSEGTPTRTFGAKK